MLLRSVGIGFSNQSWIFILLVIFILLIVYFEQKLTQIEDSRTKMELMAAKLLQVNHELQLQKKPSYDDSRQQGMTINADRDIVIIYNRVPKTASTSFVNVAYDLCRRNGFNVLHLNVTGNSHVMSIADQAKFVRNVSNWHVKKPGLYHGHVGFINFQKFGVRQNPVYINLLRKPLDRLVSYYYFLRFGDDYRPHLVRRKHGDKTTFDECVKTRQPDCNPDNMWLQIPFLCGHVANCWVPGNVWALEEAKRNLINHYLLVGVTEELPDFIALLEATLPSIFRGAIAHFKTNKRMHLRKTNQKLEPSQETVSQVQRSRIWKMENELYEFALEQFHFAKRHMGTNKDGLVVDRGRQFMFEKINPK